MTVVYSVVLSGTIIGTYSTLKAADDHRRFRVHETKQKDTAVVACVILDKYED